MPNVKKKTKAIHTVKRARRRKREECSSVIPNRLIDRPDLKGLDHWILIYLESHPDDWEPNLEDIANHCLDGIDAIRASMKRLKTKGFMQSYRIVVKGKVVKWTTVYSSEPIEGFGEKAITVNLEDWKAGNIPETLTEEEDEPDPQKPDLANTDLAPEEQKPDVKKSQLASPQLANPPHTNKELNNSPSESKKETSAAAQNSVSLEENLEGGFAASEPAEAESQPPLSTPSAKAGTSGKEATPPGEDQNSAPPRVTAATNTTAPAPPDTQPQAYIDPRHPSSRMEARFRACTGKDAQAEHNRACSRFWPQLVEQELSHLWQGPARGDFTPALLEGVRQRKVKLEQLADRSDCLTFIQNCVTRQEWLKLEEDYRVGQAALERRATQPAPVAPPAPAPQGLPARPFAQEAGPHPWQAPPLDEETLAAIAKGREAANSAKRHPRKKPPGSSSSPKGRTA